MANYKDISLSFSADSPARLDKVLHSHLKEEGFSRSMISDLIKQQGVAVDGKYITKPSFKVHAGSNISLKWQIVDTTSLEPQDVPFKVVWEDSDIIVVSKPAGVVVHPGSGNPDGTLVNGLIKRYPEIVGVGSEERPGIVHRLDKETSGLMIVARSKRAYQVLVDMIKNKDVYREYRVAALGLVPGDTFSVSAPIYRDPHVPVRMAVVPWGKHAQTTFHVLRTVNTEYGYISIMRAILSTGRTHQIRVHLRHMNLYPLGDSVYGNKASQMLAPRVFLHSIVLKFIHPFTGKKLAFMEPLPEDLLEAWKRLEVR